MTLIHMQQDKEPDPNRLYKQTVAFLDGLATPQMPLDLNSVRQQAAALADAYRTLLEPPPADAKRDVTFDGWPKGFDFKAARRAYIRELGGSFSFKPLTPEELAARPRNPTAED